MIGIEISDQQIKAVNISKKANTVKINATAIVDIENKMLHQALVKTRRLLNNKGQATIFAINYAEIITKKSLSFAKYTV